MGWRPALHPRDKRGRFTRSATRTPKPAEVRRAQAASAAFAPQRFGSANDARTWHNDNAPTDLTPGQKNALIAYRAVSGGKIDAEIRGGDTDSPTVRDLDSAMAPLPADVVLTRRVKLSTFGQVPVEELAGRKVRDASYALTSTLPGKRTGDGPEVRMRIKAPAGTPAVLVPGSRSGEVVLARDTELVIEAVRPDGRGGFDMDLVVLPKTAPRRRNPTAGLDVDDVPGVGFTTGPGYDGAFDVSDATGPIGGVNPAGDGRWQAVDRDGQQLPGSFPTRTAAVVAIQSANSGNPASVPAVLPQGVPNELAAPFHRNLDGIEQLAQIVNSGSLAERRSLTGGVSADTQLWTYPDGTRVVVKRGGNPDAEQIASMIGRAVGVDVPPVYRDSRDSVHMEYVADAVTVDQIGSRSGWATANARAADALGSDQAKLVGLFDVMIANADRNDGNWMLRDDGSIVAIDHGHAFAGIPQTGRRVRASLGGNGPFVAPYGAGVPNPLTRTDITEIRARLERIRPDVEHLGQKQTNWLNHAVAVLDLLEPNAVGTRNLVAAVGSAP